MSKAFKKPESFIEKVEFITYEVKPIFYFLFSLAVLRLFESTETWIKAPALGILAFSIYLFYRRMAYRGLLD